MEMILAVMAGTTLDPGHLTGTPDPGLYFLHLVEKDLFIIIRLRRFGPSSCDRFPRLL